MEPNDSHDSNDPAEAAEPILNAEATDPTEPIDRAEPTDPILRTEPWLPIESKDPSEAIDHFERCICADYASFEGYGGLATAGSANWARFMVNGPTRPEMLR